MARRVIVLGALFWALAGQVQADGGGGSSCSNTAVNSYFDYGCYCYYDACDRPWDNINCYSDFYDCGCNWEIYAWTGSC